MRATPLACLILAASCHTEQNEWATTRSETELSFEDFRQAVYQEPETGRYIVDGDIPLWGEKRLREFYDAHVLKADRLTVNLTNSNTRDRWSDSTKRNLNYCVSTNFGSRYAQVVQALADATRDWENAADVQFVHQSSQDNNCDAYNNNVIFDVRPAYSGQYSASAFFPSDPRRIRNLMIDSSAFYDYGPYTFTGILRHELGHVLGFRHEHTRAQGGWCYEDSEWAALTEYDRNSVMHYPECNGNPNSSFTLTALDREGAAALYGAPDSGPQPPAPPTTQPPSTSQTTRRNFSFNLQRGEQAQQSLQVRAGTQLVVEISGSGDADLYVNIGAPASLNAFACRPYAADSNERCEIELQAHEDEISFMVHGYSASSGTLSLDFVAP